MSEARESGNRAKVRPMMQNQRGEWVPAIVLPMFGIRKKCGCGAKFWTMEGYRGHYALRHIVDPEVSA